MKISTILIGQAQTHSSPEGPWLTATYKKPISGEIHLGAMGLEGDEHADRVNHGGRDKAVLAYAAEHYPWWQSELQREDFTGGALGENLVIEGGDEAALCLGDRYRIGEAIVEVSQPRQPCWKQARRWGIQNLVLQIVRCGRTGWYLRVLNEGSISVGDELRLIARPQPDWSIARANQLFHHRREDLEGMRELLEVPTLPESWKTTLTTRLARAESIGQG